jgi:MoaD family protein
MVVTLKFLGALRHASGKDTLTLDCENGASVMDVVDKISRDAPALRRSLVNEHFNEPTPNALILVNGREISVLDNLGTRIKDGDEVVFVPVVHGG